MSRLATVVPELRSECNGTPRGSVGAAPRRCKLAGRRLGLVRSLRLSLRRRRPVSTRDSRRPPAGVSAASHAREHGEGGMRLVLSWVPWKASWRSLSAARSSSISCSSAGRASCRRCCESLRRSRAFCEHLLARCTAAVGTSALVLRRLPQRQRQRRGAGMESCDGTLCARCRSASDGRWRWTPRRAPAEVDEKNCPDSAARRSGIRCGALLGRVLRSAPAADVRARLSGCAAAAQHRCGEERHPHKRDALAFSAPRLGARRSVCKHQHPASRHQVSIGARRSGPLDVVDAWRGARQQQRPAGLGEQASASCGAAAVLPPATACCALVLPAAAACCTAAQILERHGHGVLSSTLQLP